MMSSGDFSKILAIEIPCMKAKARNRNAAQFAIVALTLAVIIRTAWISSAADSTLQCAVSLINGNGPTIRLNERVVDFAHPLWMFLISGATLLIGNVFAATFAVSILLSIATIWLLVSGAATNFWPSMLAAAGLVLSKAYVDYSSSGLESPLSHFFLVYGLLMGFKALGSDDKHLMRLALFVLFALGLTRPDLLLLVVPFCALLLRELHETWKSSAITTLTVLTPILAWSVFGLFYYGSALPGVDLQLVIESFGQAQNTRRRIYYIANSIAVDPITMAFIVIGVALAFNEPVAERMLAVGIVVYLSCVIAAGATTMSGYLLTSPLLVAAIFLARCEISLIGLASIASVFAVLGGMTLNATILSANGYSVKRTDAYGISDVRGYEFSQRGLINSSRETFIVPRSWIP